MAVSVFTWTMNPPTPCQVCYSSADKRKKAQTRKQTQQSGRGHHNRIVVLLYILTNRPAQYLHQLHILWTCHFHIANISDNLGPNSTPGFLRACIQLDSLSLVLWHLREAADLAHALQNNTSITAANLQSNDLKINKAQNSIDRYFATLANINSVHVLAID